MLKEHYFDIIKNMAGKMFNKKINIKRVAKQSTPLRRPARLGSKQQKRGQKEKRK